MFREILTFLNDLVLKGFACEDIRTDTPVISFPEIHFVTEARVAETVGKRGQVFLVLARVTRQPPPHKLH
jgi:hypothetical protein